MSTWPLLGRLYALVCKMTSSLVTRGLSKPKFSPCLYIRMQSCEQVLIAFHEWLSLTKKKKKKRGWGAATTAIFAALHGFHMDFAVFVSCDRAICDSSSAVVQDSIICWCSLQGELLVQQVWAISRTE